MARTPPAASATKSLSLVKQFTRFETVSFSQAINVVRHIELTLEKAKHESGLGDTLKNVAAGAATFVTIRELLRSVTTMTATFKPPINEMLQSGVAELMKGKGGRILLVARDSETHRILALPELVSSLNLTAVLASSYFVLSAVARDENGRRLRNIEGKLDELLALRKDESLAALQAAYELLKEEVARPEAQRQLAHILE